MIEQRELHAQPDSLDAKAAAARLVQRVHHLAEHVELQLAVRRVADAHRRGILVARQPGTSHSVSRRSPATPYMICDLLGRPATARGSQSRQHCASS